MLKGWSTQPQRACGASAVTGTPTDENSASARVSSAVMANWEHCLLLLACLLRQLSASRRDFAGAPGPHPIVPRLSPGAQAGAHHRRPGWQRRHPACAPGGGDTVSAEKAELGHSRGMLVLTVYLFVPMV